MGFSPAHPIPDADYFLSRAEAEWRMADAAVDPRAAEAHHALASAYLGRVFSGRADPPLSELDWLRAEREKRLALKSVFAPDASGERDGVAGRDGAADAALAELIRRLEESSASA